MIDYLFGGDSMERFELRNRINEIRTDPKSISKVMSSPY